MAGTPRFDRHEVLDRAMQTFWRQGYEYTSIQDLEKSTGLGRGSIYNAFGDKQGLFLAVLKHYADSVEAAEREALANPDAKQAVRGLLEAMAARMANPKLPRGCLNVNTCIESPSLPADARHHIEEWYASTESAFYKLILRAQQQGQIASSADPRSLARFYLTICQGLGVGNRVRPDPNMAREVIEQAMAVWPQA